MSEQDDPITTTVFFVRQVQNYTNSADLNVQRFYSPVSLTLTYQPDRPVYFVQAQDDIIPDPELDDIVCALEAGGQSSTSISYWRIPNFAGHAFGFWDDLIKDTDPIDTTTVGQRVIQFFNAHL